MSDDTLQFGDEIILQGPGYADNKNRKFIFVSWCGNILKGYAEIDVLQENGKRFDLEGNWVDGTGFVRERTYYIHHSEIKKYGQKD